MICDRKSLLALRTWEGMTTEVAARDFGNEITAADVYFAAPGGRGDLALVSYEIPPRVLQYTEMDAVEFLCICSAGFLKSSA